MVLLLREGERMDWYLFFFFYFIFQLWYWIFNFSNSSFNFLKTLSCSLFCFFFSHSILVLFCRCNIFLNLSEDFSSVSYIFPVYSEIPWFVCFSWCVSIITGLVTYSNSFIIKHELLESEWECFWFGQGLLSDGSCFRVIGRKFAPMLGNFQVLFYGGLFSEAIQFFQIRNLIIPVSKAWLPGNCVQACCSLNIHWLSVPNAGFSISPTLCCNNSRSGKLSSAAYALSGEH